MALVVEDGTGLSTAESYVSVARADTYVSNFLRNHATWSGASEADRERALREATQTIDLIFGQRFKGYRKSGLQGLLWPRSEVYAEDGYAVSASEVPQAVERATIELAWKHINDSGPSTTTGDSTGVIPDQAAGENIVEESVKVGPITETIKYGADAKDEQKTFNKVEMILADLMHPVGRLLRS